MILLASFTNSESGKLKRNPADHSHPDGCHGCAGSRGMPWLDAHPSCASVSYQPSPILVSVPFLYCSPCLFSLNTFHEDWQTDFTLSQYFSWFCTSWAFIDFSLFCLLHAYQFNTWTLHGITVSMCDTDTICTCCWYLLSCLTST